MKKIKILTLMMVGLSLSLASCGGEKKSGNGDETIDLKPATTEVSGELEGCFTVVEKNYKVKFGGFSGGVLTVELKRTDTPLPFDTEGRALWSMNEHGSSAHVQVGFGIEFLDADGNIVDKTSATGSGLSGSYDPDEAVELVKLKEGKTGTIRFSLSSDAKDAVSFKITSAYQYGGSDSGGSRPRDIDSESDNTFSSASEMESNDNSVSAKTNHNWDSVLDSYEKFVNNYIALNKKVQNGTISPTSSEYLKCSQEALEYADKLSNAEGDMTAAQLARMHKIAAKLAAAM